MKIQTRAQAKSSGEPFYFTGKPCPHGHITERVTTSSHCMGCRREFAAKKSEHNKQWRAANPDIVLKQRLAYVEAKKEKIDEYQRAYRLKHAQRLAEKERKYRQESKAEVAQRDYERKKRKRLMDPGYAMVHRLRARAAQAYAGKAKPLTTLQLLGCSSEDFRRHIESLFKPGMSWENRGKWHIDHIIPLSSFDLLDEAEAKKAFHWSNCQPLWAAENLEKGSRVGGTFFRRDAAAVRGAAA